MQSFTVVLLLAVLSSACADGFNTEEAREILKKCQEKEKSNEDIEKMIKEQSLPTTPEGKCMMKCALEEKGLFKGGKIDNDAVSQHAETMFANNPEKMEKVAEMIAKCSLLNTSKMDDCNKVYTMLSCAKESGLTM